MSNIAVNNKITFKTSSKICILLGSLLFLIQNALFYFTLYSLPLDILGALFFSLALVFTILKEKDRIHISGLVCLIGWIITTILWRLLIFQKPEILERNLYGYSEVIILFGISALLFFVSLFIFFRVIVLSNDFYEIYTEKKRLSQIYIRCTVLYLLLHLSSSFSIVIGSISTDLLMLMEIGLFFKLFIVPAFGLLSFSGMIYILISNVKGTSKTVDSLIK